MFGYIYETINLINGKKYIGKHKSNKFDTNYLGSGIALKRAINKYGKENFEVGIIEEINTNQEDLDLREMYYIKKYNAVKDKNYYNHSYGGENEGWDGVNKMFEDCPDKWLLKVKHSAESRIGMHLSNKTKQKISNSLKGRTSPMKGKISKLKGVSLSDEHREKISKSNKGRKVSIETRQKISNSLKGHYVSNETKQKMSIKSKGRLLGKNHPMFGKHHTEETKRKISESLKRRK